MAGNPNPPGKFPETQIICSSNFKAKKTFRQFSCPSERLTRERLSSKRIFLKRRKFRAVVADVVQQVGNRWKISLGNILISTRLAEYLTLREFLWKCCSRSSLHGDFLFTRFYCQIRKKKLRKYENSGKCEENRE